MASPLRTLVGVLASAVLLGSAPAPRPATSVPRHIVSLDLCADQYLIALADPGQIAALSRYARDPELSYFAPRAGRYASVSGGAEQVLMLRPDLVIGAPFRVRTALTPLAARDVPMIDMPMKEGMAGIEETVTLVAGAVGHPDRGRALIASMRARLAHIDRRAGRGRVAAYYQRQGYLTGTGTLVDEMMSRVGLVNLATRLRLPVLSRLSVEQMALARPDFLVLESATRSVTDKGTEMLHHPLLDRAVPPGRRLYIPQALTVCGGPSYPHAVAYLAASLAQADRNTRRK